MSHSVLASNANFRYLSTLLLLLTFCFFLNMQKANANYLQSYVQNGDAALSKARGRSATVYNNVKSFYKDRAYQPIWTSAEGGLNSKGQSALSELSLAWQHGLRTDKYVSPHIEAAIATKRSLNAARAEFLLSFGVALYAHDMTSMRVNAASINHKAKYWRTPLRASTVLSKMANASSSEISRNIKGIAPNNYLYRKLKDSYIELVKTEAYHKPYKKIHLQGLVHVGQSHKSIADVRARMGLPKKSGYTNFDYDEELARVVRRFQKDNGLKTDGVIGPQTVKYMNRSEADKAEQLVANMERMRWLEPNKPSRYIEVNIPSMSLWAFENGRAALSMPVVVGRPSRQTKVFKTEVTGVRINPKWNVPPRIKRVDFWPDLKKDPTVLAKKKIDVIKGYGSGATYMDPTAVNWSGLSRAQFNNYRLVQRPGDHNALGRIRLLMPNQYNIYMHDTNHPEVFEKDFRAASSGCIRLKYPEKLADFVLKGHSVEWGSARMDEIYHSMKTKDLRVSRSMPVYVLYQTNWLNGRGDVVYGPDLYKRDQKLIAQLKAHGEYVKPRQFYAEKQGADIKLAAKF